VVYPLVFGARSVGFLVLTFQRHAEDVQKSELLVALAQQATLAVQLTRLAYSAKEAAVLMERTRIGQEIHDGLAQSFTGILCSSGRWRSPVLQEARLGARRDPVAHPGTGARRASEARRSVMALRLDQTRRPGLEIALRQTLRPLHRARRRHLHVLKAAGVATGLRPEHEHELLRIAQEAVSNRCAMPTAFRAHHHDR